MHILPGFRRLPLLVLAGALLCGCGASVLPTGLPPSTALSSTAASSSPAAAAATGPATVQVGQNARLGAILEDGTGQTLYVSTQDGTNISNCTGTCATTWVPLTAGGGQPTAGSGVTGKLTLIQRKDGTRQVAINGRPLYLYSGDAKPGDANGQGVGNAWYAAKPDGSPALSAVAAAAASAAVQVASNAALGPILVDAHGMTLYLYTKDAPNFSTCTGTCSQAWPPLIASSKTPAAAPGVTGKLGTFQRADGRLQVTINGQPLYLHATDQKPGDTTGEGLGGTWYAVRPSGAERGGVAAPTY